jgi:argininosuccinate lyase
MNATELADYLVRKGIPFRQAHEIVGKIVVNAIELGKEINQLTISELRSHSSQIDEDVFSVLTLERTLASKACTGGTSPTQVKNAIAAARKSLEK